MVDLSHFAATDWMTVSLNLGLILQFYIRTDFQAPSVSPSLLIQPQTASQMAWQPVITAWQFTSYSTHESKTLIDTEAVGLRNYSCAYNNDI